MKRLFFILSVILSLGFMNSFSVKEELIQGKFKLHSVSRIVTFTDIYTEYDRKEKTGSKVLKYSIQKTNPKIYEIHLSELDSIIINRKGGNLEMERLLYLKNGNTIQAQGIYHTFYFRRQTGRLLKCALTYVEKIKFQNN